MKKPDMVLREYCAKLNEEGLRLLSTNLNLRLPGDIAEALDFMEQSPEIDRLLHSAKSADELYDVIDAVQDAVDKELARRDKEDKSNDEAVVTQKKRFSDRQTTVFSENGCHK